MAKPKPEIPKNNKTAGKEGPITFKTILQQRDPQSSLILLMVADNLGLLRKTGGF